ncbi:MAG: cobalt ECF transporter T component CbiQ [Methanoregulaceae archaeon]|nr:cobalt ECF transporter T component CbiQ [Methanoregulaceae archaeon]
MIEELFYIEKQTYRSSIIHRLDARVKLLLVFAVIIAVVAFPFNQGVYFFGGMLFFLVAILWGLSGISPVIYFKRLILLLSFWLFLIVFQIFLQNQYYAVFHPILDLPLGIHVYAESVEFASFLLIKFLVSVSFIILLSSTTRIQDLLEGAGRLGLPAEFALALGMMVRYLFVFGYMFRKITQALETRCFDPFDRTLEYRYRLSQVGYTVGTLFIRSYEQGERTYTSMLCRGYGKDSHIFLEKKPLRSGDWAFLAGTMLYTAGGALAVLIF